VGSGDSRYFGAGVFGGEATPLRAALALLKPEKAREKLR
jgi:hypothetical protein